MHEDCFQNGFSFAWIYIDYYNGSSSAIQMIVKQWLNHSHIKSTFMALSSQYQVQARGVLAKTIATTETLVCFVAIRFLSLNDAPQAITG